MKKTLMFLFAMMIAAAFTATGFAQGPGPENSGSHEKMEKEMPAKEMKVHKKKMKKKHKKVEKEMKTERPAHEPDRTE
jgi:hypothetical protein